jgi:hypothetical protein
VNALNLLGTTIAENLAKNWAVYTASAGVLFVAFVSTMPADPPSRLAEYWKWVRSALQTAIPAARHPNDPTPPDGPATKQDRRQE